VDSDGRISSYSLGAASYGIDFDLASRITGIAETGNPPNTNTYGYDLLDRLTSAILPSTTYGYSYDGVGNRLTKAVGAGTDTYTYSSTSNRIATLTPSSGPARSFTLDPNGSTTADGLNTYTYDVRGRMVQAVSSLGTTTYQVNALRQRVRKTNTLGDRVFHYDSQGHLIGESTAAGAILKEYIWLGDMPLAVVDGVNRYYIHADHLNTPRLVANATGTTVWRWDQGEPFGVSPADENPSGLGVFDLPLRLPGQYFDKETNLHYNYYRDYDPSLGRYGESDPIGLDGGLNTYAYARGDALRLIDPTGEAIALEGVALAGLAIAGGMIYIQQQQGGGSGKKSDDPLPGPSGASSSASSSSSASGSGGQTLEQCYAKCEDDQKERDALCYSLKYMKDKSKQAQCLKESFAKTVQCYTECRKTCK
jgi:RHS repeat-associated protein